MTTTIPTTTRQVDTAAVDPASSSCGPVSDDAWTAYLTVLAGLPAWRAPEEA